MKVYPIAEEGFVISAAILLISSILLAFHLLVFGIFFFLCFLATLFFFRDPDRPQRSNHGAILSPADGKILSIEDSSLSIFMSLFDVHINRIPVNGIVEDVQYKKGRFRAAFRNIVEEENEQNTIILRSEVGTIGITQIAGIIARRIVCKVQKGDQVISGQRFGMIKFGSRIRIELPSNATINVRIRERVRGGVTIIAYGKKDIL